VWGGSRFAVRRVLASTPVQGIKGVDQQALLPAFRSAIAQVFEM
jgi:hypothetical protein